MNVLIQTRKYNRLCDVIIECPLTKSDNKNSVVDSAAGAQELEGVGHSAHVELKNKMRQ